ncbi:MAG: glycine reductase [Deltaproteobacteria bacterium]|nr:glycine reductase [Deltaproteobacteria bacterium]
MSHLQPVVKAASAILIHSPGLVRYGSKPSREIAARPWRLKELLGRLRSFAQAENYLPNDVFLGKQSPQRLFEIDRPWFNRPPLRANESLPFGELVEEERFLGLLAVADVFKHVHLLDRFWEDVKPRLDQSRLCKPLVRVVPALLTREQLRCEIDRGGGLPLFVGADAEPVGWVRHGNAEDGSLTAPILLENLCCKVSAALAVREISHQDSKLRVEDAHFVLSCSEEAVGDRYQRGGGNLAKAIAEFAGCGLASGVDIKDFCAAPIPAMVIGAAMVQSGVVENVIVVGGSSLPKLGMKFLYHLDKGIPVLEDVQAAIAAWIGRDDGKSPVLNLAGVGRHPVQSGAGMDQQLKAIVVEPLERLKLDVAGVDKFVSELHNPEVTIPANGGDVPERNYRMLAAVLAACGKIGRGEIAEFMSKKGVPGYVPTQGHIASAFAYLPHALRGLTQGELRRCFLFARASLFLGQMTQLGDGMSLLLERHPQAISTGGVH